MWVCTAQALTGFAATIPAVADEPQLISFLDDTIAWYRQRAPEPQWVGDATAQMLAAENRQYADQIVRLSFEFARGAAVLIARQDSANPAPDSTGGAYPALLQLQTRLDKEWQSTQAELDADRQQLMTAKGARRTALQGQVLELPGEIDLLSARREAVHNMLEFMKGASASSQGGTGLHAQIEALAATVAVDTSANAGGATTAPVPGAAPATRELALAQAQAQAQAPVSATAAYSLWDRAELAWGLAGKLRHVKSGIAAARELEQRNRTLSAPFMESLRALSTQGDQLAAAADQATSAQLAAERARLDALASQFKQVTGAVVPLSKQAVLLRLYQNNLSNWAEDLQADYHTALAALLTRVGTLALVLTAVLGGAALWKQAVLRLVTDPQRRHQILFVRRVLLWAVIALVIAFSFAGQFGSFATFAGLMTAGVVVALQNVLLSVAGYFFLIGKYGVRVGDRVQMGGVTGEVLDIGLVRLHLLELDGGTLGPTGRVVAFSNSTVLQSTAGLFKQLPGIHLAWHDMTLLLAVDSDHGAVRTRLLQAAESVLSGFRDDLEHEARALEKTARLSTPRELKTAIRLRVMANGLEATIYYPVNAAHATAIDEGIANALRAELEREPKLHLAGRAPGAAEFRLHT